MTCYFGILGAVKEEIAGIKNRMQIDETVELDNGKAFLGRWEGYHILLLRTGMGAVRARKALVDAGSKFDLVQIASIGYAGGLDPALKVGDLVVADRLSRPHVAGKIDLDATLVNQAMALSCPEGVTAYQGGLITVDEVVAKPVDKHSLGTMYNVMAVDMETFDLYNVAKQLDVPFFSVRAITDTADQELMDCSHLVEEDGEVSKLKAGWHVLTNPGDMKSMIELGLHAKKATDSLTTYLSEYLKNLS